MNPEEEATRETLLQDRSAKPWLKLLQEGHLDKYEARCKRIERMYARLGAAADELKAVDGEFALFWANMEVLQPSIYARAPKPEISPRFKDRRELPRRAADLIERALVSDFEADDLHETLTATRDDLALLARGVVWVSEGARDGMSAPIADHLDWPDFRHGAASKWSMVPWVARRAWLTRAEWRQRFGPPPMSVKFGDGGGIDDALEAKAHFGKAPVWEMWHKTERLVLWLSESAEDVLDAQEPWLNLTGFFPCPRPAYATTAPRSLTPIPDVVYYQAQLEEIERLTKRIHALLERLRLKGFYSAGQQDVSEALETAMNSMDDRAELVPVPSLAALGGGSVKDAVMWLPIRDVATVIRECIASRQQLIADVYELSGLSDIMRGSTDPNETLGAQELKSQYGSIRIQKKQEEMQRLARDVTRLKAEILVEKTPIEQLLHMAQVDDLPTAMDVQSQAMQALRQGIPPEQIQQELANVVTLDEVQQLISDQRTRPFVLDIETDSTVQPDRVRERQQRMEFTSAVGGFIQQAAPVVMQAPMLGPITAETLRHLASAFDVPRALDAQIDELAEALQALAQGGQQGPSPAEEAEAAAIARREDREDMLAQARVQEIMARVAPPAEPVSVDPLDKVKLAQADRKLDLEQDKVALEAAKAAAQLEGVTDG